MSIKSITLIADPEVLAVPIKECYDPFIDLRDQNVIAYGDSPEVPNNTDYTKMRQGVYEKLIAAQSLLPHNLRFCIYEAYRSLDLQSKLFDGYYMKQKQDNPSGGHEELFAATTKLVSPVVNLDGSRNIPPHATGVAIDVYLIDRNGDTIDMGMPIKNWMQDLDASLSQTDSTKIPDRAKEYRKIVGDIMSAVGFANYPMEYWHWSYGDRYWAYQQNAEYAIYDIV
jgi:D-alanyl-D-alanine dipeptidase